jgi:hypothetical protein
VASTTSPKNAVCKINIFTRQRYNAAAGNPDRRGRTECFPLAAADFLTQNARTSPIFSKKSAMQRHRKKKLRRGLREIKLTAYLCTRF